MTKTNGGTFCDDAAAQALLGHFNGISLTAHEERFKKLESEIESLRGGSGGDDKREKNTGMFFDRELLRSVIIIIGATLIAAFSGFLWLEGRLKYMMVEASPYAREKGVIELKLQSQDEQIKELHDSLNMLRNQVDNNSSKVIELYNQQDTIIRQNNDIIDNIEKRRN